MEWEKTKVARNTTVTWNMSHEYIIIDSISYPFLTCTIKKHRENSIMIMDTKILIKMRLDIMWKEKEMATSSKSLSWRIPYTEEPGVVQSRGSWRVRHDWATEHTYTISLTNYNFSLMVNSSIHLKKPLAKFYLSPF